jgi:hypothetical protein
VDTRRQKISWFWDGNSLNFLKDWVLGKVTVKEMEMEVKVGIPFKGLTK